LISERNFERIVGKIHHKKKKGSGKQERSFSGKFSWVNMK